MADKIRINPQCEATLLTTAETRELRVGWGLADRVEVDGIVAAFRVPSGSFCAFTWDTGTLRCNGVAVTLTEQSVGKTWTNVLGLFARAVRVDADTAPTNEVEVAYELGNLGETNASFSATDEPALLSLYEPGGALIDSSHFINAGNVDDSGLDLVILIVGS